MRTTLLTKKQESQKEIRKLNAIIECDDKIIEDQAMRIVQLRDELAETLSRKIDQGILNMTNQTERMQKALELLKQCSEELFFNGKDIGLETEIDEFLMEMGEKILCVNECSNCEQCPSTLRTQAD